MSAGVDPITFAVVQSRLTAAALEMRTIFKRTAMLPMLYEFNDFGMSIFDDRLEMLADAPGLPIFVGSLDGCLEKTIAEIGGVENVEPGDILLNNHPYLTAGQPPDAAVMVPAFHDGQVIAWSALKAHMGDVGGKGLYAIDAVELFQEGTIFPALKLYERGQLNETITRILAANSRLPVETVGCVLAGASAAKAGAKKIEELVEAYGIETYRAVVDQLLDHGERMTREAIERIPDGTYVYEDWLDNDNVGSGPVRVHCAVTIDGSDWTIDLSDSAPQQRGAVNCPWGYTVTTCRFAMKRITTPLLPANGGQFRPLTIIAPEGTLFNPKPPAASFAGHFASIRLADNVTSALAPALPDVIPAECGGDLTLLAAHLVDPSSGRIAYFGDLGGTGHGAKRGADGMNALIHGMQAGCEVYPAEVIESRMPVIKHRFELIPDSGGAGTWRGGLASRAEFEFLAPGTLVLSTEKAIASSVKGLAGGFGPDARNTIRVHVGTDREYQPGKAVDLPIEVGDRVIAEPAGGGGFGDPLERGPEMVAHDVREGYVSADAARALYGVVFAPEPGWLVDDEATDAERARHRAGVPA